MCAKRSSFQTKHQIIFQINTLWWRGGILNKQNSILKCLRFSQNAISSNDSRFLPKKYLAIPNANANAVEHLQILQMLAKFIENIKRPIFTEVMIVVFSQNWFISVGREDWGGGGMEVVLFDVDANV